jgi:hypothetical protein
MAAAVWALCGLLGCGQQEIRAIERLPEQSPDRGRMQVRDGNLLTDKGTRLRGAMLGVDAAPDAELDQATFDELSHGTGLNGFHVYLENYADETGANAAQADQLVELTSRAGMYLLIGIGGGHGSGTFDLAKIRSFWDFYAPRYAQRSHVMYEIQNQPELTCDAPLKAETLDMERETYSRIRALAPDTHIAFFSFHGVPTAIALESSLDALAGLVDWSRASVGFHDGDNCATAADLPDVLLASKSRGVATFVSELTSGTPIAEAGVLETARVGWFNFHWLVQERDLELFRSEHDAAAVSWCPDFGTWPEDAQRCTAP